jgi:hypothetical protein
MSHWSTFVLRTSVFALRAETGRRIVLRTIRRLSKDSSLRLLAAGRAHWSTFVLRTPVFALRAAGRAHATPSRPGNRLIASALLGEKQRSAASCHGSH